MKGKKVRTQKYFCSVQDFIASKNKDGIKNDVEFMTHPDYIDGILTDNTLPFPHPFVSIEWIKENGLRQDNEK